MTIEELKSILKSKAIPDTWYSLDGSLLPDRTVLYRNYDFWEVFYFDERGNTNNIKRFSNEEDAYQYILDVLSNEFDNIKLKNSVDRESPPDTEDNVILL